MMTSLLTLLLVVNEAAGRLTATFSKPGNVVVGYNTSFSVTVRNSTESVTDLPLLIKRMESNRIAVDPMVSLDYGTTHISVKGLQAGTAHMEFNSTNEELRDAVQDIEVSVTVIHSEALDVVIEVVGWIYFIAWSISFYPQIVYNFQRKSVVGLNFDFLTYNLTGFLLYGMFNVGMFWITTVKV
jgi:cystinosin